MKERDKMEISAMPEKPFIADMPNWGSFWDREAEAFKSLRKLFKLSEKDLERIYLILEHIIADERLHKHVSYPFKPNFEEALVASLVVCKDDIGLTENKIFEKFVVDEKRVHQIANTAKCVVASLLREREQIKDYEPDPSDVAFEDRVNLMRAKEFWCNIKSKLAKAVDNSKVREKYKLDAYMVANNFYSAWIFERAEKPRLEDVIRRIELYDKSGMMGEEVIVAALPEVPSLVIDVSEKKVIFNKSCKYDKRMLRLYAKNMMDFVKSPIGFLLKHFPHISDESMSLIIVSRWLQECFVDFITAVESEEYAKFLIRIKKYDPKGRPGVLSNFLMDLASGDLCKKSRSRNI